MTKDPSKPDHEPVYDDIASSANAETFSKLFADALKKPGSPADELEEMLKKAQQDLGGLTGMLASGQGVLGNVGEASAALNDILGEARKGAERHALLTELQIFQTAPEAADSFDEGQRSSPGTYEAEMSDAMTRVARGALENILRATGQGELADRAAAYAQAREQRLAAVKHAGHNPLMSAADQGQVYTGFRLPDDGDVDDADDSGEGGGDE